MADSKTAEVLVIACYPKFERKGIGKALMQKEGLKDGEELQSYFIKQIEKFINSKDRKLIGWDEILEGGLAPNVPSGRRDAQATGRAAAMLLPPPR